MRAVNSGKLVSADYQPYNSLPPLAEDTEFSYVMSAKNRFARLDIHNDDRGHFDVLGSLVPNDSVSIKLVTWIPIKTTNAAAFEDFVEQGPKRVLATEPETLLWFSLRHKTNSNQYAIIDLYAGESGLIKHNEGEVAAALKANASRFVAGGWKAVVSGAIVFEVIASSN